MAKWYIKEWQTGRYLLKTGVRHSYHGGLEMWFHAKSSSFTHSKQEAHGFDREKNVIKYIRQHQDLRTMFEKKEIYYVEE